MCLGEMDISYGNGTLDQDPQNEEPLVTQDQQDPKRCKCKIVCVCAASGQICADCMRPWGGCLCGK